MPVLGTKVHVPRPRPRLVARPRLTERLDATVGSGTRLVLVSAPAGFGKTTLLTQWLDRLGAGDGGSPGAEPALRVAWLSLDPGDSDPRRFLTHLVAAVRAAVPSWPDSSLGCPKPNMNYLQVITPGYRIVLEAQGRSYEYHTDTGKRVVRCEKAVG